MHRTSRAYGTWVIEVQVVWSGTRVACGLERARSVQSLANLLQLELTCQPKAPIQQYTNRKDDPRIARPETPTGPYPPSTM